MNTLKRYPGLFICCLILLIIITASIIAPFVSKEGPLATSASLRLQPPSAEHIFGTDEYGRDILSRVCYGIRISFIGVVVVVTSAIGIITGILCGLFDRLDMVVSRIMDGLMAFPEIFCHNPCRHKGLRCQKYNLALSFAYFPKCSESSEAV